MATASLTTCLTAGTPIGSALPSDTTLLDRISRGNQLAMQAFFARHKVRVYRFVLRILGDGARAEDVVSDVFLDVWRQSAPFRGNSSASTWLLTIARNKAASEMRRRREVELDDRTAAAVAEPADSPDIAFEAQELGRALRRSLRKLSAEHREVLDLVYYHEKSVEQVGAILGIPEGTVKSRMWLARRRLAALVRSQQEVH